MEENLKLVFVNRVGINHKDEYEYVFYYSDTPDLVWAEDFPEQAPSTCLIEDLIPNTDTYSLIKKGTSRTKFELVQYNSCFSIQDCMDGILSMLWIYDDSDGKYYGLPYGTDMKEAELFLEEYGVTFTEAIEVNKDKNNADSVDDSFDKDGALMENEEEFEE